MKRYLIAIPVISLLLLTSCYATRADVQKEVDSLTNQVNQLREENKGLQQQLAELRTAVGPAGIQGPAGPRGPAGPAGAAGPTGTAGSVGLQQDVSELRSEVYGFAGSARSSRIDKLEEEDISGLKTDVSKLNQAVFGSSILRTPSPSITSSISSLESKVTSLESKVTILEMRR